jgi:NAD(P)-dependent dehydrogenase (short-subunit alcohol dehydrogenase family)
MGPFFSSPLPLPLPPSNSLQEKTILITGANTGLGFATAQHALALGASTLILAVRSISKGLEAKTQLLSTPDLVEKEKKGKVSIHVWELDLESFESVESFVSRVKRYVYEESGRLDAAVLNAGLASVQWKITGDGWERSLQVNVLSTAWLVLEMVPLLLRSRTKDTSKDKARYKQEGNIDWKPHLTILASDIHKTARFTERDSESILKALNNRDIWAKSQKLAGPTERYAVTKLLDIYITREIARLVPRDEHGEPSVIVNCVAPGFCKSNLLSREEGVPWIIKVVQWLTARSVEEGSKTIADAIVRGGESHGGWVEDLVVRE